MLIRAAEADDQADDQAEDLGTEDIDAEGQVNDDGGDEDDAGTEDDAGVDGADDAGEAEQLDQRRQRRAIEDRAERQRNEIDPTRLAAETAAAAAQATAREQEAIRRRADEERREQDLLATMSDEQRATYQLAKGQRDLHQSVAQTQLLGRSASDQSRFDRLLNKKPQYDKHADEVERRHQQALNQGSFVPRDAILAHLIGELALKDERAANVRRQKNAGAARVANARGTGRSARGDTTGGARGGKTTVQRAEEQDWAI